MLLSQGGTKAALFPAPAVCDTYTREVNMSLCLLRQKEYQLSWDFSLIVRNQVKGLGPAIAVQPFLQFNSLDFLCIAFSQVNFHGGEKDMEAAWLY